MSKIMRYDGHMHPNTSRNWIRASFDLDIDKRMQRWWQRFRDMDIRIIACSEHAYANPVEGYYLLRESRPEDFDAVLIPSVEAFSSEGFDLLVMSDSEAIFDDPDIVIPGLHPLEELVELVAGDERYQAKLPHIAGSIKSAVWNQYNYDQIMEMSMKLGMAEPFNFLSHEVCGKPGFWNTVLGRPSFYFMSGRRSYDESHEYMERYIKDCQAEGLSFSVGNDAHDPAHVNVYGEVEVDGELTVKTAFEALKNNKDADPKFAASYYNVGLMGILKHLPRSIYELKVSKKIIALASEGLEEELIENFQDNRAFFDEDDLLDAYRKDRPVELRVVENQ